MLLDDFLVIGVHQSDPAFFAKLTPSITGTGLDLGDGHGVTGADIAHNRIVGAGAGTNVHIVRVHRDQYGVNGVVFGEFFLGKILNIYILAFHPTGIQGQALGGTVQLRDLLSALERGIPTGKGITLPGGSHPDGRIQIRVIGLDLGLAFTAVELEHDIAVIIGNRPGIDAVEEDVGFDQAAGDQGSQDLAAGIAPLADLEHEFVAGDAVDQASAPGRAFPEHPRGTKVVCKEQQRIELLLVIFQTVLIDEAVQALRKGIGVLAQQRVGFFVSNAVLTVALQIFIRTAGTMTDGPLGIVPTGVLVKAFHGLQQFHTFIADGKLGSGGYGNRVRRDQAENNDNRQQE